MADFKKIAVDNLNLIFSALAILTSIIINNIAIDFSIFWQISIGLLTFVGVFYAIVYKPKFLSNRDNLLRKLWISKYPKIKAVMIQLDKIFKTGDIKTILGNTENKLEDIVSIVNLLSEEQRKIDFEYYMKGTIIFAFITIIISVIANFLSKPFYIIQGLSLNTIITILFFTTFYATVKFLMSCYKVGLVLEKA